MPRRLKKIAVTIQQVLLTNLTLLLFCPKTALLLKNLGRPNFKRNCMQ
tara:strand:+ start:500 stop:643 length:144 start_codon:yes stop_codon:yes gene_type:complete